ncbi:hypothetical protein RCT21_13755 [Escherichia marmotae]|nr:MULTISPECIES: hypothetical protein [Escherichia]MDC7918153.1 hypothetical protein [Escherichia coli]MEC9628096.1 hypothetical protein [Escherichia marmotae]MED0363661.1 hypothetical protein [Escherichia marmotae]MED8773797.1 hypothetical protein [Escherichia marmotae]MED9202728.1 hypothetical protein [Escherichia marmotae]
MMTEFKRPQRDYPLSFKIAVVEQVDYARGSLNVNGLIMGDTYNL